ncbi:UDP-2,3-diacylglucosamine diphosphatase [Acidomonas methanolica]|uniref:UDP-2,3-diacylglucosamine diphosphatase n=1 Tax=Acidomonas methanolica TaxID=437 RepID=UPI002119EB62|nr:UDP-2,3-diacylglucosamine diphosphatase [Acidomonas methanolica]MCQ9155312.1 UDP-2,3-diacylglucosamine diphosphatase [Acidomonas methanolica]
MDYEPSASGVTRYRALFISDVHLGTRDSKAALLRDFLASSRCETLYLVGDIIDGWRLRRSWFWNDDHDSLLRLILQMAASGTEVIYIPGNHDEMFRSWLPLGLKIASIRMQERAIHEAADGRRFVVLHGDEFDSVVRCAPMLAHLGDWAYALALWLNRYLAAIRRRLGLPYRSFSAWAKRHVKEAVKAVDRFEEAVAQEAKRCDAAGVICGHIHTPEIRMIDGSLYMNTGDWVESCSGLAETMDGRFILVSGLEEQRHPGALPFRRASRSRSGEAFADESVPGDPWPRPALTPAA